MTETARAVSIASGLQPPTDTEELDFDLHNSLS